MVPWPVAIFAEYAHPKEVTPIMQKDPDMKLCAFLIVAALLLGACGSVTNETTSSIVVDRNTYELRTRTIQGPNGAYDTSSVRVKGTYRQCQPDSPGSCEAAVRNDSYGSNR